MRWLCLIACALLVLAAARPSLALERCPAERLLGFTQLLDAIFGDQPRLIRWPAAWDEDPGYYLVSYYRNIRPTDFLFPMHSRWMGPDYAGAQLPAQGAVTASDFLAGLEPRKGKFAGKLAVPALAVVGLDVPYVADSAAVQEFMATFLAAIEIEPQSTERWEFPGDCQIVRLRGGLQPGMTFAFVTNATDNLAKSYCLVNAHLAAGGASGLGAYSDTDLLAPLHDGRFFVNRSILHSIYGLRPELQPEAGMTRCEYLLLTVERLGHQRERFRRGYAHLPDETL